MKWISLNEKQYPLNIPVLVTDGKDINLVLIKEWIRADGTKYYYFNPYNIFGREYEFDDFDESKITHWASPELPNK